jgi:two-component system response regulator HydG
MTAAARVTVLVVDDDAAHASSLGEALETFGYVPRVVSSGSAGLAALRDESFDLVLTDLRMAGVDGMQILQAARRKGDTEVVRITGHGSVESAVDAMRAGAAHYVTKPVNLVELREVLARLVEQQRLRRRNTELEAQLDERYGFDRILGRSAPMQNVFRVLRQVAPTDVTVLISGESGTGKELVARAVHQNSRRRQAPFIALNCAALPESLLESELFGHEKGSFTGATARKIGHIENAQGGTLFLDEVGDMPLTTQVKVLRVLEQREITRVGSSTVVPVDIRVLAATNQNLVELVADRKFREDLYFRLKVVSVELPPLRARLDDVPVLAEAFLTELTARHGTGPHHLAHDTLRALQQYAWPGNVRELRNAIETLVVTAGHDVLLPTDLPPNLQPAGTQPAAAPASWNALVGRTVQEVEREHIRATLEAVEGNRAKAARMLAIGERTLYRKIKEYGL